MKALITGANRGLGLALTRQLLEKGTAVFATCRRPDTASDLHALKASHETQLTIVPMDVADDESVAAAQTAVSQQTDSLDWIINNAGVYPREGFRELKAETMLNTLNINTVGPMRVVLAFLPLLRRGNAPKLINISSQLGSINKASKSWGSIGYNSSKVALNMATRHLAFELAQEGVVVLAIHPGWVQTDMGGSQAAVTVENSAENIIRLGMAATEQDNGQFYTYEGKEHPW